MTYLEQELQKRQLPSLLTKRDGSSVTSPQQWEERREEILEILQKEMYGITPPKPEKWNSLLLKEERDAMGGKAVKQRIELQLSTPAGGIFSFPFELILPKEGSAPPVFLYLSFRPSPAGAEIPLEELVDNGFGVAVLYYQDIAADREDQYESGLAGRYPKRDPFQGWGKISMWAWALSRVMDYLQTLDHLGKIAVVGHSRLGKAALWCGAQDRRFSLIISNDSGCSGAALTRGKIGEDIAQLSKQFPYWFCGNYNSYSRRTEELPFDQHFLLALAAPRNLYICSASEDLWADPASEFLSCAAVSPLYQLFGKQGLVAADRYPQPGEILAEGTVAYHLRKGTHYIGRFDWLCFMEYRKKKGI